MSHNAVAACIGAFAVGLSYAYSPRGYSVGQGAITVKRVIGGIRIPLEGMRQIRAAEPDDFKGCIRLWGSGGLFGYYGLFRTSKLGRCTWHVTDRKHGVVITSADGRTYVVSPDDVAGFLAAAGGGVPASLAAQSAPDKPRRLSYWVGGVVAVVALLAVGSALLYSPGLPQWSLTHDALTIQDRFYPVTVSAASVEAGAIQTVDIGGDGPWRITARTNGFANARYRAGWFRAANGRQVRMYAASGSRLVLLPPKGDGTPVLLEVRDPEQFTAELRRAWGGSGR